VRFYIPIFILLFILSCARKGQPDGGPKDESSPILVTAKPAYKTLNFNSKEIRFYFDEYIVLKNLNEKLIISPPLKNPPVITPAGIATKHLKIVISDTLKKNTTYTFNFGDAIQDNNENNKLENFKYIFSTGDYIDSLTTKGTVANALEGKLEKNVNVVLYELDTAYTDSTFYKKKPTYVTNTLDSLNFEFTNIKKGKYVVMALDEESSDYIFNSKSDKVAFLQDTINLPENDIINKPLYLFKEIQPYKFKKGREVVKGKIQFGYTGKQDNIKANLTSKVPEGFKSFSQLEKDQDTLNYWFTPIQDLDSLNFIVSNKEFLDTLTVRLRKKEIDSLIVSATINTRLNLSDTLFLNTNNPIDSIDKTKFSLFTDTIPVNYEIKKEAINRIALLFKNEPKTKYKFDVLPGAILDLYETSNDTLSYTFSTKEIEDYGSITFNTENKTNSPLILELLEKDKVVKTKFISNSEEVIFNLLEPKEYGVRIIIDSNKNKKWDTGSFLNKIQPERIIYFSKKIELRANWTVNESIIVE